MSNYFRNLEETLESINPEKKSVATRIKRWTASHLRFIWTMVMMSILLFFCLWISIKAGGKAGSNSVVENILEQKLNDNEVNAQVEKLGSLRSRNKLKTSIENDVDDKDGTVKKTTEE